MADVQLRTIRLGKTCAGGTFGFSIGPSGRRAHVISRVNKDVAHLIQHGDELVSVNGSPTSGVPHDSVIQQIVACNAFVELQLMVRPRELPHRRQKQTPNKMVDASMAGRYAEGYEMGSSAGSNASRAAMLMSLTEWQDPDGADKNPESAVGSFTKSMSKFKTVAKVVGKMAILANEPRPQKALQLQKAHDILNIGDRLREERDAEMKAAKEKAVKEATYEQKKIAAQQFKELRKLLESQAKKASESQARDAAAAQVQALQAQAAELAQRQALAVRDARNDEVRIKKEEMAAAHKRAELRQATAVKTAEQRVEATTLEKCRLRQLTAIKISEKKLWEEAAVKQEAALKAVERQHAAKIQTLVEQQKTKLARIQEQCSQEEAAVTALENMVSDCERKLEEADKKYAGLERTHHRMLEIALPNYDANDPWL